MEKKLQLSRTDRVVLGVIGGICTYFGWPSATVRLLFVLALILGVGTPIVGYIILWFALLLIGGTEQI